MNGVHLMNPSTIEKALVEQIYGNDLILGSPMRYGLGFGLRTEEMAISPNSRILFWVGAGGSAAVMDIDAKVSWAYVMNKMGSALFDTRATSVGQALYSAL